MKVDITVADIMAAMDITVMDTMVTDITVMVTVGN